jgi:large subunit ribosomal protein L21
MYAVIRTGGKQYRVEPGQRLEVERLKVDGAVPEAGAEVDLAPVLLVDDELVLATPSQLGQARVRARIVGDTLAKKIRGFTYKPKSNNRRRWGHRQHLSMIEITEISPGSSGGAKRPAAAKASSAVESDDSSDQAPRAEKK